MNNREPSGRRVVALETAADLDHAYLALDTQSPVTLLAEQQAIVIPQKSRRRRHAEFPCVIRIGDNHALHFAQSDADQAEIRKFAVANCAIDIFIDRINETLAESTKARWPKALVARRSVQPGDMGPALHTACELMKQCSVPVVVECILECVTNIAMSNEINAVRK